MRISPTACVPTAIDIDYKKLVIYFLVSTFYVYTTNFVEDYKGSNQIVENKKVVGVDVKLFHSQLYQ